MRTSSNASAVSDWDVELPSPCRYAAGVPEAGVEAAAGEEVEGEAEVAEAASVRSLLAMACCPFYAPPEQWKVYAPPEQRKEIQETTSD